MEKIVVVGSLNIDTNIFVPHIPKIGETIIAKEMKNYFGGKGANQAMSIARLGGKVEMIAAVGDDAEGKKYIENLRAENIGTQGIVEKKNMPTGMAIISVDEKGQNNIIVYPGANYAISKEDINQHLDIIKEAKYCVLQLEIPLEVVEHTINTCYENDTIVILNPAPAVADIPAELLSKVDFFLPNETELDIISKEKVRADNMVEVCRNIINKGCKNVIVTLGDKGSLWVDEERAQYFSAYKVKAVDTTAAGDSFIGAFAFSLSKGKSIEEAIRFATRAASITVTRKGAQSSLPYLEELADIIQVKKCSQ
ncbi:MAG TPA: ribokinase [Halanaerobiaceae bacterium]|jgi:ribokinase|nr:ribokinase [Bacillota bacterium]HHU91561.1 ribokinase [Halanaerobiaceae bacterium]HOA41223.1 ribokinase [Halanaerobiales bacterium]HPZ63627.1 ribokinase [Halanaerobiales bacterium]HQD04870.1 ribokinase [Halanaerobiales bacterium]